MSQGQKELAWALSRPAPAGAGRAYHWARATLLTKAGHLARRRGDFPTARRLYEAGLALRRETGQLAMLPFSLRSLGGLALDQGDFPTARACHGEALALRREAGCPNLCETLLDVGRLAQEDGDGDGARRLLQEGLDLARANALPHAIATGHDELGRLAWLVGDQRWARTHHEAALAVARELGDKGQTAAALDHLGRVRAEPGGRVDGGPAPRGGPDPGLGVRRPAPRGQLPGGPGGRRRLPWARGAAPPASWAPPLPGGTLWAPPSSPAGAPGTCATWSGPGPRSQTRTSAGPGGRGRPCPWSGWSPSPSSPESPSAPPTGRHSRPRGVTP